MINFAAFTPHSPLLVPQLMGEKRDFLPQTVRALSELSDDLYAAIPDVICLISSHGHVDVEKINIVTSPLVTTSFSSIGDFSIKREFKSDLPLIHAIREQMPSSLPVQLISEAKLDYGHSVPLHLLIKTGWNPRVIIIHHALFSNQQHYQFGKNLREVFEQTNERVAIISTGDLSHSLREDSPAGYHPHGQQYVDLVQKTLQTFECEDFLNLTDEFTSPAQECSSKSIAILLGVISSYLPKTELLAYEDPQGVGYLTANFLLT